MQQDRRVREQSYILSFSITQPSPSTNLPIVAIKTSGYALKWVVLKQTSKYEEHVRVACETYYVAVTSRFSCGHL